MIREGYNEDIDTLRRAKTEGKNWLADLENTERERTGIKNLRVKYNKVFGYYLEVTKSYLNMVPEDYIRKQTLTNAERYTTPRLKELEDTILNAEDKLCTPEYDLFCEIRDQIAGEIERSRQRQRPWQDWMFSVLFPGGGAEPVYQAQVERKGLIHIKTAAIRWWKK